MSFEPIQLEDVHGRSATARLLPHNPLEALKIARAIRHPWYRCQALSAVAASIRRRTDSIRLLQEALRAAREQEAPNRVITVASWPLRVLLPLDAPAAAKVAADLLARAETEPHGLRRLHALDALLGAVADDTNLREAVAASYKRTAGTCKGWRAERTICFRAQHLAVLDARLAQELLAGRVPSRYSRRAVQVIRSRANTNDA